MTDPIEDAHFITGTADPLEEGFSRNASQYHPTGLYRDRINELGPIAPDDVARRAIESGEFYEAKKRAYAFVLEEFGVAFYVFVKDSDTKGLIAMSVWPYVYDEDLALNSGTWLPNQLNTIKGIAPEEVENDGDGN
jgi:hypothetical protein